MEVVRVDRLRETRTIFLELISRIGSDERQIPTSFDPADLAEWLQSFYKDSPELIVRLQQLTSGLRS
jgi:hypothetical protein